MRFALVFPGQGSQSVGMLAGFARYPVVRETLAEAGEALGENLIELIENGPAEVLGLTTNTQPVMLAADIAVYRAFREAGGPVPAFLAGHSLGEYAALVAAGALDFAATVRLVRLRAKAMQEAVPFGVGAMAAILGLDAEQVTRACAESADGEIVEAVNFNDPVQTVIAGHTAAVARASERCKALGAKRALPLPVSAPFHSNLMKPAADKLAVALEEMVLNEPGIAVINNVDVQVNTDPLLVKDALVRQAYKPVRWVEVIQRMQAEGVTRVIECGPGKVLSGLSRRIDRELDGGAINDQDQLETVIKELA
jgi:[acyl-carrier-protein] S-malonyltransferase